MLIYFHSKGNRIFFFISELRLLYLSYNMYIHFKRYTIRLFTPLYKQRILRTYHLLISSRLFFLSLFILPQICSHDISRLDKAIIVTYLLIYIHIYMQMILLSWQKIQRSSKLNLDGNCVLIMKKTKIMIFCRGKVRKYSVLKYGNDTINVVHEFEYLGVKFN